MYFRGERGLECIFIFPGNFRLARPGDRPDPRHHLADCGAEHPRNQRKCAFYFRDFHICGIRHSQPDCLGSCRTGPGIDRADIGIRPSDSCRSEQRVIDPELRKFHHEHCLLYPGLLRHRIGHPDRRVCRELESDPQVLPVSGVDGWNRHPARRGLGSIGSDRVQGT